MNIELPRNLEMQSPIDTASYIRKTDIHKHSCENLKNKNPVFSMSLDVIV